MSDTLYDGSPLPEPPVDWFDYEDDHRPDHGPRVADDGSVFDPHAADLQGPAVLSGADAPSGVSSMSTADELPAFLSDFWDDDLTVEVPEVGQIEGGGALFWQGRLNAVFGPGGDGKTWLTQWLTLEEARAGRRVLVIDYEDHVKGWLIRLKLLGMSAEEAGRVAYWRLTGPLEGDRLRALHAWVGAYGPSVVIFDSVGAAMATHGLDENHNADCMLWIKRVPEPLTLDPYNVTVVTIDHEAKSDGQLAGRRSAAIGGVRKLDAISGALYRFDVKTAWSTTQSGDAHLVAMKDRGGATPKGQPAARMVVDVDSDSSDVRISMVAPGAASPAPATRLTWWMEIVSQVVEAEDGLSQTGVEKAAKALTGKTPNSRSIRSACDTLAAEGFIRVDQDSGGRGTRHHHHLRPYRQVDDPASDKYVAEPDAEDPF